MKPGPQGLKQGPADTKLACLPSNQLQRWQGEEKVRKGKGESSFSPGAHVKIDFKLPHRESNQESITVTI